MILKTFIVSLGLMFAGGAVLAETAHKAFFDKFAGVCGKAFSGAVAKDNLSDPRFGGQKIILHVRDCTDNEIQMPMHVGDDHSRTFILRLLPDGLEFRHDHRHRDGTPDAVTLYGGVTTSAGSGGRQDFPADEKTKVLFLASGLNVSVDNVWTVEVTPERTITYALTRPNREFQIVFKLDSEVANPPVAWGQN